MVFVCANYLGMGDFFSQKHSIQSCIIMTLLKHWRPNMEMYAL